MSTQDPVLRALAEDDHQKDQWRKLVWQLHARYARVVAQYAITHFAWTKLIPTAQGTIRHPVMCGGKKIYFYWTRTKEFRVGRLTTFPLTDAEIAQFVEITARRVIDRLERLGCRRRN